MLIKIHVINGVLKIVKRKSILKTFGMSFLEFMFFYTNLLDSIRFILIFYSV